MKKLYASPQLDIHCFAVEDMVNADVRSAQNVVTMDGMYDLTKVKITEKIKKY